MIPRIYFLLTFFLPFAAAIARGDNSFSLPGETFAAADRTRLTEFTATLDQKQFAAAALLLDAMLSEDAEKLMSTPDGSGSLISISAWIDALPRTQRTELEAAYRQKFDAAVAQQLEEIKHDPLARVDSIYNLARRHRFCPAALAAYAEAGDRSLDDGDLPTAHALYQLALRGGWTPDETHAARIESLRRLDEGALLPLNDAASASSTKPFAGPIPFDAIWFNASSTDRPRFIPLAADDHIFVAGPNGAAAFREGGQVLWNHFTPPVRSATSHPTPKVPASWQPALLTDIYGRGQILINRQVAPQTDAFANNYVLHASRASDGKPLWATESQPLFKDLSFVGTPAIAGRYTYVLALSIQEGGDRATLSLVALDTMSGSLRWQATLGNFSRPHDPKNPSHPWDDLWSQGEPLVAGDAVYVAPGCGVIACIGRLEGKIRWLRGYKSTDAPPLRWRSASVLCGTVLITSAKDSADAIALDAANGKSIWSANAQAPTLIGNTATLAIFAGPQAITTLAARDGHPSWRWEPSRINHITGPAVIRGDLIYVPTNAPITSLHAEDGTIAQRESTGLPFFRRTLNADVAKHALDDQGAGKSFGQ